MPAMIAPTTTMAAATLHTGTRAAPGTGVSWSNEDDDPHTVTADDRSFDSKGLGQGETYRRVFAVPGRYPYHCAAHPFMKGVVIVTGGKAE